jgi:putative nucleotidyltransferase with HDIG domain
MHGVLAAHGSSMSSTLPPDISDEAISLAGVEAADAAPARNSAALLRTALDRLEAAFGQPFLLLDARTGEPQGIADADWGWDTASRLALIAATAERGRPEIVEHESPLSMLVIPLAALERGASLVAVSVFLTMRVDQLDEIASAARVFGVDPKRALAWAQRAEAWTTPSLMRMAEAALDNVAHRSQLDYLQREINEAVAHARETYAELGLLHRLMRRLSLSEDDGQLWRRSVQWLAESVPAQCVVIVSRDGSPEVLQGQCPLNSRNLNDMLERLGPAIDRSLLLHRSHTTTLTWSFPTVRELACAPIVDGGSAVGWLLAINHTGDATTGMCEFGSAEIRLLESVATILGVHRSNTGLLDRQADLFGAAVRALISTIEAKDRYTLGHSERVARVAARLAEQLCMSKNEVETIYLGGLLHDIGKIGVDDQVLNKPGALTPEEYGQIKQHPQLGYDILRGMRQLEPVLPIVLHHHEAWDGSGYPHGLKGDETPLLARVTAVADAFDAMSSDRPYRRGMPDEKVDAILREGSGRQWDPLVVEAFFAIRDEIGHAARDAAFDAVPLDATAWVN